MQKPLILMIHGAWHWGGCFQKVADLLTLEGFPVATPDLASHGYDYLLRTDVAPARACIECTVDNAVALALPSLFQWDMSCAEVRTLAGASHSPFFSRPQELAKVIAGLATR